MSPSTAPPFCSLTRSARIVPLTRPQTVMFCAMTLPSTCAPSLIWRSEARTSPSIRPKTCAGPLHSMLPTIDMSEPMQEAIPAFVVGSDLAQAWSCGCTTLPMTSAALTDAFLSFSGAPLFVLFNISTSMPEPMQEAVSAFGTSGVAATCSTTECCCCTIPPVTSSAFAAAFLSFSGALLLNNMSTSVFTGYEGPRDGPPPAALWHIPPGNPDGTLDRLSWDRSAEAFAPPNALIDCLGLCEIGCAGISGPAPGENATPPRAERSSEALVGPTLSPRKWKTEQNLCNLVNLHC